MADAGKCLGETGMFSLAGIVYKTIERTGLARKAPPVSYTVPSLFFPRISINSRSLPLE